MLSTEKNDLKLVTCVSDNKIILDYYIVSNMKGIINNLMNFIDLPYYFNIDHLEIWRLSANFYGYYYDRKETNHSLWLSTGLKKNYNILMPFFYDFKALKYYKRFWKVKSSSWTKYAYLFRNSFGLNTKNLDYIGSKWTGESKINIRSGNKYLLLHISDKASIMLLSSNKSKWLLEETINSIDHSISTYCAPLRKKFSYIVNWFRFKQQNKFRFVDSTFFSSSLFSSGYLNTTVISPETFFESVRLKNKLDLFFNLATIIKYYDFDHNINESKSFLNILQNNFYCIYLNNLKKYYDNIMVLDYRLKLIFFTLLRGQMFNFIKLNIFTKSFVNRSKHFFAFFCRKRSYYVENKLNLFSGTYKNLIVVKDPILNFFFNRIFKNNCVHSVRDKIINFIETKNSINTLCNKSSYFKRISSKLKTILSSDKKSLLKKSKFWFVSYVKERNKLIMCEKKKHNSFFRAKTIHSNYDIVSKHYYREGILFKAFLSFSNESSNFYLFYIGRYVFDSISNEYYKGFLKLKGIEALFKSYNNRASNAIDTLVPSIIKNLATFSFHVRFKLILNFGLVPTRIINNDIYYVNTIKLISDYFATVRTIIGDKKKKKLIMGSLDNLIINHIQYINSFKYNSFVVWKNIKKCFLLLGRKVFYKKKYKNFFFKHFIIATKFKSIFVIILKKIKHLYRLYKCWSWEMLDRIFYEVLVNNPFRYRQMTHNIVTYK